MNKEVIIEGEIQKASRIFRCFESTEMKHNLVVLTWELGITLRGHMLGIWDLLGPPALEPLLSAMLGA
jgi:hypothetical protein